MPGTPVHSTLDALSDNPGHGMAGGSCSGTSWSPNCTHFGSAWQGYFAECRMMVSGIECETGKYIIYDKLKKG